MKSYSFGATGRPVARIGQGSWYLEDADPRQAIRALRAGMERGMTHIDTAEYYGHGAAEALIAEAIEGCRDSVYLVSKVMPSNADRAGTREACERSLRFLGTDHLDCYLLHWRGSTPLQETIEALELLVEAGKILAWGVSNFDEDDLAEALRIAGPDRIACNQVLYNLHERNIEHAVLPWCESHSVAVVGYTPFGTRGFPPTGAAGAALEAIAERHAATPRQVTLAYLSRREGLFTIPKAANPQHACENAGAGDIELSPADSASIEAAFPLGRRRPGIAML